MNENFSGILIRNANIFIQENAVENVIWKMVAISFCSVAS